MNITDNHILLFFSVFMLVVTLAIAFHDYKTTVRDFFKDHSKIALLATFSNIFATVIWGTDYISKLSELSRSYYAWATLIVSFVALLFYCSLRWRILISLRKDFYLSSFVWFCFAGPVFYFYHKPFLLLVAICVCFITGALINLFVSGFHFQEDRLFLTGAFDVHDLSISKLLKFSSDFANNNPDKQLHYHQNFFKLTVQASFFIVIGCLLIYGRSAHLLDWNHYLIAVKSDSMYQFAYNNVDLSKGLLVAGDHDGWSNDIGDGVDENIYQKIAPASGTSISMIHYLNRKLIALETPSKNNNLKKQNPDPTQSKQKRKTSSEPTPASDEPTRPALSPKLFQESFVNFFLLRNVLSLIFILIFAYFLNSKSYRDDYVDKWKLNNAQLMEIFKADNANIRETHKLKFCHDLLETKMWGHKSFHSYFVEFLREQGYSIDFTKTHRYKDVKSFINKKLLLKTQRNLVS